jgi:hypothetical protein
LITITKGGVTNAAGNLVAMTAITGAAAKKGAILASTAAGDRGVRVVLVIWRFELVIVAAGAKDIFIRIQCFHKAYVLS